MWCAISVEGLAFELICVVPLYFSTSFEISENQSRSRVTCSWKAAEIKGFSEFQHVCSSKLQVYKLHISRDQSHPNSQYWKLLSARTKSILGISCEISHSGLVQGISGHVLGQTGQLV